MSVRISLLISRLGLLALDLAGVVELLKGFRVPAVENHELNQALGHLRQAQTNLEAAGRLLERRLGLSGGRGARSVI
jgi:hypothetical protein